MREVIRQKIADALVSKPLSLTRRDARLPNIPRKARAIVGMRRSGKTCFLQQCRSDRLAAGIPAEALIYFSFEDERLAGMQSEHLDWVIEEYFARCPEFRDQRQVTFFFDEIQVVPGWETFIRRVLDTEKVEIFVSGSSARMLSREVATALRGRATETVIFPFSFREYLRHHHTEIPAHPNFIAKALRSRLARAFNDYLEAGGFPEAQHLSPADRIILLQSYVDTCIFRDVVERHGITNVTALRHLVRQLLGAPAGRFSVNKCYNDFRSQGIAVAKDALHQMLAHLEDAFLVRVVPMATRSERQRQVNPRKIYPVDPALIPAFDRSGRANIGHALETAVLIELERRGCEVAYVMSPSGFEVDFLAVEPGGNRTLIQVAADLTDPATREREFQALSDALPQHRRATALLLTLAASDVRAAQTMAPANIAVRTVWEWMLEG
jgi:uncharacterized protein